MLSLVVVLGYYYTQEVLRGVYKLLEGHTKLLSTIIYIFILQPNAHIPSKNRFASVPNVNEIDTNNMKCTARATGSRWALWGISESHLGIIGSLWGVVLGPQAFLDINMLVLAR